MKLITQTKFWQLPFAVKLAAIWLIGLGINKLWKIKVCLEQKECVLGDGSILFGVIFLHILGGLFTLAVVLFESPQLPQPQATIVVVALLILNLGFLIALLQPSTKVFFTQQTLQEDSQWQGNAEGNAKNKT